MGINVSIVDRSGADHPTWDWVRHAGDRTLAQRVNDAAHVVCETDAELVRPVDLDEILDLLLLDYPENRSRWRDLQDILSNGDWWLRFSY